MLKMILYPVFGSTNRYSLSYNYIYFTPVSVVIFSITLLIVVSWGILGSILR